jgi:hypothetical protein
MRMTRPPTWTRRAALGGLVTTAAIFAVVACGNKAPTEVPLNTVGSATGSVGGYPPGYPGGGAYPTGYPGTASTVPYAPTAYPTTYPPATGYPSAFPTASTTAPTPSATGSDLGALLGSIGSSLGLGTLPGNVSEAGLAAQAAVYARGMTPEGALFKKVLGADQHESLTFTMQPGRCYTVLGFSPPGAVKHLMLSIMAPPFYTAPMMTSSAAITNRPVVGHPQPTCPLLPIPVPYKLDIHAKSGTGEAVVQIYSKPK